MTTLKQFVKFIPALYFSVLGISLLVADILSQHVFSWPHLVMTILFCIPLFIRRVWAYILLGSCYILFFGYLLIIGIAFFGRFSAHNPTIYMVAAILLLLTSVTCASWLIWQCIDHSGKTLFIIKQLN